MKRTKINIDLSHIPSELFPIVSGADIYDSSCSPEARVIYIDRDGGYFLKRASLGALATEAAMDRFFFERGLGARVLSYLSEGCDWLLTERVPGEDCTHSIYLSDPARLCDTLAELLASLHGLDCGGCPIPDRLEGYFETARRNYLAGVFDPSYSGGAITSERAWRTLEEGRHLLRSDTLIHGDYCLPNIMLDGWTFSKFIDVGNGGIGDRHVDLFWGAWTLNYNLGTDEYRGRFFDAYGRDMIDPLAIRVIEAAEYFG